LESRVVDTFIRILDLGGSRFGAAQVLSVLEYPAVYQRFDLSEADIDMIRRWVQDTRIRWGIDEQNRRSLGLPGLPENTWRTGLERLLLGFAMPGEEEKMFKGILPYDFIEGNEAAVLGKFLEFTDRLFSCMKSLERLQSLSEWSDTLKAILDGFFNINEDTEDETEAVRQVLNGLAEMQDRSGFDEKADIHVIRSHLANYLQKEGSGFGFIAGGVTFCAMLPMRSRYLFLESVLSAREKLYISYMGQSIRDNSDIPPSVLVSEIMDYIEKGFEIPEKNILSDHIVVKHRLQAFSPEPGHLFPKEFPTLKPSGKQFI